MTIPFPADAIALFRDAALMKSAKGHYVDAEVLTFFATNMLSRFLAQEGALEKLQASTSACMALAVFTSESVPDFSAIAETAASPQDSPADPRSPAHASTS